MISIGIDVGGTHTDGALLIGDQVHASCKTVTTANITDGIDRLLQQLLMQGGVVSTQIDTIMLGTTHFLNALTERKHLTKVAVIRLCLPAASFLLPFTDWPLDAKAAINGGSYLLSGGYQYDGKEISALNEKELQVIAKEIKARDIKAVAISSVFSFINPAMELRAAEIIRAENPAVYLSMSHCFMRPGLLERENVAVINAALMPYAEIVLQAIQNSFSHNKTTAKLYLNRNDGTLMSIEQAKKLPILTFASGPTNSMRGAAKLTGLQNALVVDIGGTTTDIGVLHNGFPRSRANHCYISGIRCHFSIPDVLSIGLGGGSVVNTQQGLIIGPLSVGAKLMEEALVFGGKQLTLTDIYVVKNALQLGDCKHVAHISHHLVDEVARYVTNELEVAIDTVKASKNMLPVIVVGGGNFMVNELLSGVSDLIKPQWADVANAVGAAMGEIAGDEDSVYDYDLVTREVCMQEAKQKAITKAIANGALSTTVEVIEINEVPIPYLPGKITRLQVRAIGKL
jgi:N-methylhydantoinase A/oxoprolinase/acetone carboxylase beta subunit